MYPYEPQLEPRPSLSRPEAVFMAQAWIFKSLSPSKPSLSHGFQAKPSCHDTNAYQEVHKAMMAFVDSTDTHNYDGSKLHTHLKSIAEEGQWVLHSYSCISINILQVI